MSQKSEEKKKRRLALPASDFIPRIAAAPL
jgi:hypothetical protein